MRESLKEILTGKKLSILGDSISTYEGISNDSSVLRSLAFNPSYYYPPFSAADTYWLRLVNTYGLQLCVNNSWSGAFLSERIPGMGKDGTATRSPGVVRVDELSDGEGNTPDIIVVFMGINDLGCEVEADVFEDGYKRVVERIKTLYPNAVTFCMGMPFRYERTRALAIAYNEAIVNALQGDPRFVYVDLFHSEMSGVGYLLRCRDGLHPHEGGMAVLADILERAFLDYYL